MDITQNDNRDQGVVIIWDWKGACLHKGFGAEYKKERERGRFSVERE